MTNQSDPVALLEQIYDHTEGVLAEVDPDQYELTTPCTEWNVRELVNHVIGSVHVMASAVVGDVPPAGDPPDFTASNQPAKEFRTAADRSLAVWRTDGALDGTVRLGLVELPAQAALGINQLDVLTHSWDVAEAIGADRSVDPPVAESVLAASQMIISDEMRGECPMPADPVLAEWAAALSLAGDWGWVVVAQWNLVYMTDEQRLSFAAGIERVPIAIGEHMFGPTMVALGADWRTGPTMARSWRELFSNAGGMVLADTPGGRAELESLVYEESPEEEATMPPMPSRQPRPPR